MKPRHLFFTLSTLAGLVLAASAIAQPAPAADPAFGPPNFADVDANKDGVITPDELNQYHSNRMAQRAQLGYPMRHAGMGPPFAQLDRNADGSLSPEEFPAWQGRGGPRGRWANQAGPGFGPGGGGPMGGFHPCWWTQPNQ